MTPEQKAKNLVEKFIPITRFFELTKGYVDDIPAAKEAALICVDEIILVIEQIRRPEYSTWGVYEYKEFWLMVKQSINKL